MAPPSSCSSSPVLLLFLLLLLSGAPLQALCNNLGVNYGRIGDDLPPPSRVAGLLQSLGIGKVKIYDAEPTVLKAFLNTDVEITVTIGNENLVALRDVSRAREWIEQNVQPYLPNTRITCIIVGNEVLAGNDPALMSSLLPAMQAVREALLAVGLGGQVNVTTAHAFNILASSYPPSVGSFRQDLAQYIQPILDFHAQSKSPFLVNVYPFFAYKADPQRISLPYVLFEPNSGVRDPNTNLNYDNMLYAQIDSVYSAAEAMGHTDIDVWISETGWPSKGDPDEIGATPENAATYNRNLVRRIAMREGTPLRPSVPIGVHIFGLFTENLKPGPASERNYGLFHPDATPVYDVGLPVSYDSSTSDKATILPVLISLLTFFVAALT